MADGQVIFEISGDNRKVQDALRDTTTAIECEGKKWDKAAGDSADDMAKKLGKAFKAIAASAAAAKIGQALTRFGQEALQAASDLEEVQNVVDVTFGDGARQIEAWAQTAGQQFGLTETQAKKFTSTLGAMMKSAGLAGPEIVNMSTDLAGLAADMASFYNLDFEEAFQKIRSGISGETEPLKQLGINMSVANLEAYALSQGIDKAFDQMSQGEQTMLRYQYLMQATADAQGDFARTSEGYANSLRQLETNLDQLKTRVGNVLLPIIGDVVSGINDMLAALTQTAPRTVLDDFADIDLKTEEKLESIQATATEAGLLVDTLEDLGGRQISSSSLVSFVESLTGKLGGLDKAMDAAKKGDYAGTLNDIAQAMAKSTGTDANAWNTLLTAIGEKLPAAYDATLDDKGQTAAFLAAAGAAADSLGGEYPALWAQMLQVLGDNAGAAITALANGATAASALESLANGANALKPSVDADKWEKLLAALSSGRRINFLGNAGQTIAGLANALNGNDPNTDRAQAWAKLLGALSADVENLSQLTGTSAEDTAAWLKKLADGANALDPSSADGWAELFGQLVTGLPGLAEGKYGDLFEELTGGADDAEGYLRALGYSTEDITNAQEQWLEVCRRLVQTIPGLNSIINTETGEVTGGTEAVREYIRAWEEGQTKLAMLGALQQKESALASRFGDLPELQLDAALAERRVKQAREKMDAILHKYGLSGEGRLYSVGISPAAINEYRISDADAAAYNDLAQAEAELEVQAKAASEAYQIQRDALTEAQAALEEYRETIDEMPGEIDAATEATEEWTEEQKQAATTAVEAATAALEAVEEYYQRVRESTASTLGHVVGGFSAIETPAEKARQEMRSLTTEIETLNAAGKDSSGARQTFNAIAESIPTVQNMTAALKDQLAYLTQYKEDLEAARAAGVSEDILAYLSDGSVESADYLHALATGSKAEIAELNEAWQSVTASKDELTTSLTETKLAADESFQGLADAANSAVAELDQYGAAKSALDQTVQGIADGIAERIPSVQTQVDALNAVLARLGSVGSIGGGLGSLFSFRLNGSLAKGLDYVPFDNYLAALHEGESILTAEEAKVWRAFKNGGASVANNIDYEAMGSAMRDNVKPGGNVYLDGRIVGRVISEQQADSLRALERSGWQG